MMTLESYVQGRWHAASGRTRTAVDPSTEEPIAVLGTDGIDFEGVLRHARETGGPALRALPFAERAARLKALSAALHEHRDELLDLSMRAGGNTRSDAKFDVDGATGTLAAYAAFARGAVERGSFLVDGEGAKLGRTPRFWGQHVLVPRRGAAIHVNAFNFPAWNMCEKMACALLAGMPVIEKPGTPTAPVAWRLARIVVESGLLPEGAFQILCGGAGDLLDRVGPQDVLAFTGSSETGTRLRSADAVVRHSVHVNVEADSLNPAILAPDVEPGSDAFDLLVSNVALDVTQKAGQKCTAVRRVLVPEERTDDVAQALVEALGRVVVGNPFEDGVRMGPVASAEQLEGVQEGIRALAAEGELACGGTDRLREKGYFLAPTLVLSAPGARRVHEREVFGPCAAVVPYSGSAEAAAEIASRGGGGLVASVYSNDARWTEECVLGLAPWHGRIWIGSDKSADQAVPPGTVLPASTHGGPGRAGGGEELGGLRGLALYLQRTAIQGYQGLVASVFGPPKAEARDEAPVNPVKG